MNMDVFDLPGHKAVLRYRTLTVPGYEGSLDREHALFFECSCSLSERCNITASPKTVNVQHQVAVLTELLNGLLEKIDAKST